MLEVFVADEQTDQPVEAARWVKLAEQVLDAEGITGEAELSILFIDEPSMADLNQRFLGKQGPTDVLSFPIDGEPEESGRHPDSGGSGPGDRPEPDDLPMLLGDIVICPTVAARNAPDHTGNYDDELALMVVHGILHLLGQDHEGEEEAERMEARERVLLSRFHHGVVGDDPVPAGPAPPRLPPRSTADVVERLRRGDPSSDDPGGEDP